MKLVSKFKQCEEYAVRNSICAGQDLAPDESHPVLKESTSYRKLVGSLLYIANATRPDIILKIGMKSHDVRHDMSDQVGVGDCLHVYKRTVDR